MFGAGVETVLKVWTLLAKDDNLPGGGTLRHYMWTLMFLKGYGKTTDNANKAGGVDEKTFRKWVWLFIPKLADLEGDLVSRSV